MTAEPLEMKCPHCEAAIKFDIESQTVMCPFCGSKIEECEVDLGSMNEVAVTENENIVPAGTEWTSADGNMVEYRCRSCGGEIYTDENTSATMCPYCGSSVVISGRLSGSLRPDKVIPFKVTKEDALDRLKGFCSNKKLLPDNFFDDTVLKETKGLYVPFWVYDIDVDADVKFIGCDETRTEMNNTTYITKYYYDVDRAGSMAFEKIPVDGSKSMPDSLMESIEPYCQDDAVEFEAKYLSGFVADKYDVDNDTSKNRAILRAEKEVINQFGNTVRHQRVDVKNADIDVTDMDSNYVLYPVWLFNTTWRDKFFTFAMNGQTGKIAGDLPADDRKVRNMFLIYTLIITLIATVPFGYIIGNFLFGAIFSLVLGLIVGAVVTSNAKNKLHTVFMRDEASDYIRRDSFKLTRKSDRFLYKNTRRI